EPWSPCRAQWAGRAGGLPTARTSLFPRGATPCCDGLRIVARYRSLRWARRTRRAVLRSDQPGVVLDQREPLPGLAQAEDAARTEEGEGDDRQRHRDVVVDDRVGHERQLREVHQQEQGGRA